MTVVRVVDDTPEVALLLELILKNNGFKVKVTTEKFLDLLTVDPWIAVDVAVVDLMMPEVSGAQIIAYLKANHPWIRRVVWTAWQVMLDDPDLRALADAVIGKPSSIAEMVGAVNG